MKNNFIHMKLILFHTYNFIWTILTTYRTFISFNNYLPLKLILFVIRRFRDHSSYFPRTLCNHCRMSNFIRSTFRCGVSKDIAVIAP